MNMYATHTNKKTYRVPVTEVIKPVGNLLAGAGIDNMTSGEQDPNVDAKDNNFGNRRSGIFKSTWNTDNPWSTDDE